MPLAQAALGNQGNLFAATQTLQGTTLAQIDCFHHHVALVNDLATGARYGVESPRDLDAMFDGSVELTLAAHGAGEGAVKRHGNRIPPFRETQGYVRGVLRLYGG
ncbi:lytic transglycosylase domain-containing protein [Rhizobacter sp. Root1221]|uniref:lytic transglycosylase domain-containing protein n=1 Tax=Rhizobacter sp. Root1221 TaxID=1736433 RepID=UPI0006FD2413|nr:hypothetical protein ASC87_14925 [Rhizobacter sp. Root1221]